MTGSVGPTKVDYIGAMARSGSTMLHLLLGGLDDRVAVGEVRYVWERGVLKDHLCGCGQRFSRCHFWSEVGESAFGGWGAIDIESIIELHGSLNRERRLLRLLFDRGATDFSHRVRLYTDLLAKLYAAIGDVAGARTIVDSSKSPSYALLLRRTPGVDLRVIHLIRDSRGVAFSRTKLVRRSEVVGDEIYMERHHPLVTAVTWMRSNLGFDLLRATGTPTATVTYRDFVAEPIKTVGRLDVPISPQIEAMLANGHFEIPSSHSVSGHPMRIGSDPISIQADDAWKRELPLRHKLAVTAVTIPMLVRYRQPVTWR